RWPPRRGSGATCSPAPSASAATAWRSSRRARGWPDSPPGPLAFGLGPGGGTGSPAPRLLAPASAALLPRVNRVIEGKEGLDGRKLSGCLVAQGLLGGLTARGIEPDRAQEQLHV